MDEKCRKRFDALTDYLDRIHTIYEVKQAHKLIEKFVDRCSPPQIYKVFLEFKIWNLEKSLLK